MNHHEPLIVLPSELSDETAYELLNFLQALTTEIENHYAAQIRRHLSPPSHAQPDLFDPPWDDDKPPF